MDLGPPELLIILLLVLLLFGGAKLPGLARSLGEAKREFHKATSDTNTTADAAKPAEATKEVPAKEIPAKEEPTA